jgi:hypothetical protein
MQVPGKRHAAHGAPRRQACLSLAQAATAMLVFQQREMRRHLAIEVVIGSIAPKDVEQSKK